MITILKQTPVTFKGSDALEVLVLNDEIKDDEICAKCAFRHFIPEPELFCNCMDVHGCTANPQTYIVIIQ